MMFASLAALGIIVQIFRSSSAIIRFGGAALCIVAGGVVAALAISAIYDVEAGPDPRRFSLAANVAMDTVVVAVLAALGRWIGVCVELFSRAEG